ncbi:tannase/feruloyl esterase family alpha/beta hydrolase [Sphingobium sp. RAC03]|uniref:tannase/feruloyl esterase family alpha/beta hydrolase n=1 Tax=Sphingobium sp. RAC03 TaxID=1843368 RepID=UPI000857BCC7|nr:tannase/feruloyl esterase family alpha/beta hydrolase [Sphingobium sp. RAC03]AOF97900.1 prolyl oligopeptidase family protein [Sphingobium sp. RAC03]
MKPSRTIRWTGLSGAVFLALASGPVFAQATSGPSDCGTLVGASLTGTRIVSATPVAAGALKVAASPIAPDLVQRVASMPAFCRVVAVATPTPDSQIGIEIWLPLNKWNGRLLGTGNGGGAGRIAYEMGMVEGLKRGFAVANTDMGTAPAINSTIGHPERWVDFGHRATHEMTRVAKTMVSTFYKVTSFRSYFEGCSTGGQQALSAAQRYPEDYDGILAGDPGNNRTHVASYFLWNYAALNVSPLAKLSAGQWAMVSRAVLANCAGKDGGAPGDRFLIDPRRCSFDPASLPICRSGTSAEDCLTAPQLATVQRLYAGPTNPHTGERIYAGLTPGSEDQPLGPVMQGDPATWPDQQFYPFRWTLGAAFVPSRFDFDSDLDRVDAQLASVLNANSADLSAFARRGGKLMIYSGLADPAVPFAEVVNYYDRLEESAGSTNQQFARLFLVPGMGHCFGGPGVTDIGQPFTSSVPPTAQNDALMTLVAWTEGAKPPAMLIARTPADEGQPAKDRPICAYPALPQYRSGDASKQSSFVCVPHSRGVDQRPADRYLN